MESGKGASASDMTIAMAHHHRNGLLLINDLVKSHEMDGIVKSFRCKAREFRELV